MEFQESIQRVMSGEAKGLGPSLLRTGLALGEPFYRWAVYWRNRGYDKSPASVRGLPRPVISIGNISTGGTGKTPIVRWLAQSLRKEGIAVGILSRGYKAVPGSLGDEQRMLQSMLAGGDGPNVEIEADPDRFAAGVRVLGRAPHTQVFLLDDGFQHRRLRRECDIVLLHGGEPFGFDHVLPRGLMREPPSSLKRASAIVITHNNLLDDAGRARLIGRVRKYNSDCPIVFETHAPTGFRRPDVDGQSLVEPMSAIQSRSVFCFSGLGSPGGFESIIRQASGRLVGAKRFVDHHDYSLADLTRLQVEAAAAGADLLVTTEKDWIKLAELPAMAESKEQLPIWRLDIQAEFQGDGEAELLEAARRLANLSTHALAYPRKQT